jgi:hypothetical protein
VSVHAPKSAAPVSLLRAAFALAALALAAVEIAGCAAASAPLRCRRFELGSVGPENDWKLSVASDNNLRIDHADERLVVAFSVVGVTTGPVTLVHEAEGREPDRWPLTLGPASGISVRCALARPGNAATCRASLTEEPLTLGGQWRIEANGNQILEAGLSARLCP